MKTDDTIEQLHELMDSIYNRLKQTEKSLETEKMMYRSFVEDQPELICRFLPTGHLTFANTSYREYFSLGEQYLGVLVFDLIPEDDARRLREYLITFTEESPVKQITHDVASKNGVRVVEWIDRAIFIDNEILVFQSVGRDVTERVEGRKMILGIIKNMLSKQQYEIVSLMVQGDSPREVARKIGVEPQQVYTNLFRIKQKFNNDDIDYLIKVFKRIIS